MELSKLNLESLMHVVDQATKEAQKKKYDLVAVDVKKEGTQIILPDGMSYMQGIECLDRKMKEENTVVSIHEEVIAFPLDGAHAFSLVLQRIYGWAQAVPTPGFFGPTPPNTVNLEVGFERHVQIVWGRFKLPNLDGYLNTSIGNKDGQQIFVIGGEVKLRHKADIKKIADMVREVVKSESVYKGKAIRLKTTAEGHIDFNNAPKFLDCSKVKPEELIFSDTVMAQVKTNLFTPIAKTKECRENKIPLKRGVLLEGPYGTGKTLTAYVTAALAEQNGWTFIYLDNVSGLKAAMVFARQYGPAVIFAEDIDRIITGERSHNIDDVLNTIDGVDSKGQELITILTTNYVENIELAMMRPGRLDAVISFEAPDAKAAEKLVRLYARNLLDENADLSEAGKVLAGQIPATIREVVERSKLYAISTQKEGEPLTLSGQNLVEAGRGMKRHLELMAPKVKDELTPEAQVGKAMKDLLVNGSAEKLAVIPKIMKGVKALADERGVSIN